MNRRGERAKISKEKCTIVEIASPHSKFKFGSLLAFTCENYKDWIGQEMNSLQRYYVQLGFLSVSLSCF